MTVSKYYKIFRLIAGNESECLLNDIHKGRDHFPLPSKFETREAAEEAVQELALGQYRFQPLMIMEFYQATPE